jgi:hypothetical protein
MGNAVIKTANRLKHNHEIIYPLSLARLDPGQTKRRVEIHALTGELLKNSDDMR